MVKSKDYIILLKTLSVTLSQSGFNKYPENQAYLNKANEEVPVAIQLLLSGECVSLITSSYYFFHAKTDGQSTGTNVYSGNANQQEGEKWKWTFEVEKSGDKFYFYLKNLDTDQYMYATNDKYPDNTSRRILSMSTEKKDLAAFKWVLDPKEGAKYFYMTNLQFNEGLVLDTNSKKVFTRVISQGGTWSPIIIRGC